MASQSGRRQPGDQSLLSLLFLALLLVASCAKQEETEKAETAEDGLELVTDRDLIAVRLRTDRKSLTIADRVQLWLEVDAPENFEVNLPPIGDKLQQFGIVDVGTEKPVLLEDGKLRRVRHYLLEPFLSGSYKIPPMAVTYRTKDSDEDLATIETKEATIEVKSELTEDQRDRDIHDIEHSVLPEAGPHRALAESGGTGAALAMLAILSVCGAVAIVQNMPRGIFQPTKRAYAELRELVAANLVEQGMVKEFYCGISDILRRYLERRFGLHAPERTTEEFLAELAADNTLVPEHKAVLAEFLQHCDLVKFAKLDPTAEEIQHTFDACKNVIEQTKEVLA